MQEELLHIFPLHLRETLQKVTMKENTLEEIRIRIGQPVIFHMENAGRTPHRSGMTSSAGRWKGVTPVEYLFFEYPCGKRKTWLCKRHHPISDT